MGPCFLHHTNYDMNYTIFQNSQNDLCILIWGQKHLMEEMFLGGWLLCVEGGDVPTMTSKQNNDSRIIRTIRKRLNNP